MFPPTIMDAPTSEMAWPNATITPPSIEMRHSDKMFSYTSYLEPPKAIVVSVIRACCCAIADIVRPTIIGTLNAVCAMMIEAGV